MKQAEAMQKLAKSIVRSNSNAASGRKVKKARRRIKKGKKRINAPTEDYFNSRMNKRLVRHGYDYKGKRNAWVKKPRYTPQEDAIDSIGNLGRKRKR